MYFEKKVEIVLFMFLSFCFLSPFLLSSLPFSFPPYSMTVSGETALDRLANALGGKAVLPHIISIIPKMLTSGNPMILIL